MALVNAKYLLVKNKTLGIDPRVDLVLNDGACTDAELYSTCKAMYLSAIQKSYVESCLLASSDLEKISDMLDIPVTVLEAYRYFFFNIDGLNKLSKLELVDDSKTDDERTMKIWALSQGLDFLGWRLGKQVNLSPIEGMQELYTLSVYKSKEALFSSNSSTSSIEAAKWTKLSMDMARHLKAWVMDNNAAKRDIELALKALRPEFESIANIPGLTDIPGLPGLPEGLNGELKEDNGGDIGDLTQLN